MRSTKNQKAQGSGKAVKRASLKGKGREEVAPVSPSKQLRKGSAVVLDESIEPWSWSTLADPQVSTQPALFTKDARYFFIPVSSSVKIYSTATGKVVSTLTSHTRVTNGHSDRVTCLKINPQNSFQLFAGSSDDMEDYVFVACKKPNKKKGQDEQTQTSVIMRVSLRTTNATSGSSIQKSSQVIVVGKARMMVGMDVSASGKWLVVAGGTKVYVASTAKLKAGFTKFACSENLTCLSVHPKEDWIATGDEKGQLRL
ncbi:17586_t:CDS:2, partial [Acaulospora colombiana]